MDVEASSLKDGGCDDDRIIDDNDDSDGDPFVHNSEADLLSLSDHSDGVTNNYYKGKNKYLAMVTNRNLPFLLVRTTISRIQNQKQVRLWLGGALVVALLVAMSLGGGKKEVYLSLAEKMMVEDNDSRGVHIFAGNTSNGIPYLHCKPSIVPLAVSSDANERERTNLIQTDVVLLHAANYKAQEWNTTGILDGLCRASFSSSDTTQNTIYRISSVTALQLSFRADHEILQETLDYMKQQDSLLQQTNTNNNKKAEEIIHKLYDDSKENYRTAIITPASSGKTIMDWLLSGDIENMKRNYVQQWIPVLPMATIRTLQEPEKLKGLVDKNEKGTKFLFSVLAVHCTGDQNSMEQSQILQTHTSNSTTQLAGIPGEHPCYLHHPDNFLDAVRPFLVS